MANPEVIGAEVEAGQVNWRRLLVWSESFDWFY